MAVHGGFQRCGLAIKLLTMIEKEAASQIRDMGGSISDMLVRTGEENTGRYWTEKGFTTQDQFKFEPGQHDSKIGFW